MKAKAVRKTPTAEKQAKELLKGAIDFHIHTGPDIYPRLLNDVEVARQAKRAGMRAVLIKSHVTITADRAQIAQAVAELPVFGGVTLNWQVGGLNRYAVECAAKFGARQVWMPTTHAAQYLKYADHVPMFAKALSKDVPGITILNPDGSLVPEMGPILEIIASNGCDCMEPFAPAAVGGGFAGGRAGPDPGSKERGRKKNRGHPSGREFRSLFHR